MTANKLHWTVRVSEVRDFYALKNDLYQWNKRHRGHVTFDNMKAKRVARLGWFEKCHANLHGHQDMRQYLHSKLIAENVSLDYEISTQYV